METNDRKEENFAEDFKDFDDEAEAQIPELEQDLVEQEQKEIEEELLKQQEEKQDASEAPKEIIHTEELNQWEEFSEDNSVVKKYIFYVSKDFVPYIDNLTTDERSAYINDAIQKKIDLEDIQKNTHKKRSLIVHLIVAIITIFAVTPFAILGAHKAIMLTFDNYKYSQDNFEKLYKKHFENNKAYMRSLEYNKKLQAKNKQ